MPLRRSSVYLFNKEKQMDGRYTDCHCTIYINVLNLKNTFNRRNNKTMKHHFQRGNDKQNINNNVQSKSLTTGNVTENNK